MAHNLKLSNLAANAAADAVTALLSGGFIDIYSGTQPATANTALSGNTLLASLPLGSPATGSASSGVSTYNAITSDTDADATGTATFARIFKSDHTTVVMDISVGAGGTFDLVLNTTSIVIHGTVNATAGTYTQPKS